MKQLTLAASKGFEKQSRSTRKAEFLARMEGLMPWAEFCALIEPHYPKVDNRRPPEGLERMLQMYCIANWFNLSDVACEDALYDGPVFREFYWIDLGRERIPDATTLMNFRHRLETHHLGAALFAKVGELLMTNGMRLSGGTIVDAMLIAAPPSTKKQDKSRDPEMHQTKKGKDWHFGMKLHIGVSSKSGLVHSANITATNVHDSHEVPKLLHGQETRLNGDSTYRGKAPRERLKAIAPKAKGSTNKRAYRNNPLTEADKATNRRKSSVRSKVEHPFLTLKRLWVFAKVCYRSLAKKANRMLAMLNIHKWGRSLTEEVRPA